MTLNCNLPLSLVFTKSKMGICQHSDYHFTLSFYKNIKVCALPAKTGLNCYDHFHDNVPSIKRMNAKSFF